MGKADEINYIEKVARIDDIPVDAFHEYLARKPFSDPRCGEYLADMAQVMNLLPAPPAKVLDIGVGSGWTSELLAQRGYDVLGLDISPNMIAIANRRIRHNLTFAICDYETDSLPRGFAAALIYDSLHHAEDEARVIRNVFNALVPGGIFVTVEPGTGHSTSADSLEVMRKYGTTEKDMPYSRQRRLMRDVGFSKVRRYLRVSQLVTTEIATPRGVLMQIIRAMALGARTAIGKTSIVVAVK